MAPAREGADGAPVVRRDGTGERRGGGDDSFFTPRAALLFAVLMVGALFWEEALEVRARAGGCVRRARGGPDFPCAETRGCDCFWERARCRC